MTEQPQTIKALNEALSQLRTYLVLGIDRDDKILLAANGSRRELTAALCQLIGHDSTFADIFLDAVILVCGSGFLCRDPGETNEYAREVKFLN